jgi:hypothetical protein
MGMPFLNIAVTDILEHSSTPKSWPRSPRMALFDIMTLKKKTI